MASVDIDALSAREIKERLTAARVDFSDCFEKRELVKRLRDHCRALDDDKVQEVKALANSAFSRGGFALAIRYYTEALSLCGDDDSSEVAAQLRSNRAIALLKLNQVAHARTEAEECTKRAPWFAKGYLRLAAAAARLRHPLAAARACVAGLAALEQQGEQRKGKHTDSDQPEQPASRAPAYPSLSAEGREGGAEARAGGGEDRAGDARPTPDERLRADLQELLDEQLGILGWSGEQLEHLACSSEQLPHCSSELLPHLAQPLPDARAGASYQACTLATGDVVPASCLLVDELTDDVLAQVFAHYLSPVQVCLVARTCRILRGLCNFGSKSAKIWQGVCSRLWPRQSDHLVLAPRRPLHL
eukprot:Tamp_01753.p1 GENE.Tamp_01753~~Tamp_01753.p1  ORF type:complete len:371 (+),score=83.88 Tamp_01753:35-1114(+)